jgi:hypothetical protein
VDFSMLGTCRSQLPPDETEPSVKDVVLNVSYRDTEVIAKATCDRQLRYKKR